ncbi:MAG: NusG domain II-containing protein [Oscillospiraceae bacterium]|nr:NusG domain II-containing protein [Oscillospiraceae bacterium]
MKKKKLTRSGRNDGILIAVLLVVGIGSVLWWFLSRETGGRVIIRINGQITATYSLNENGEYKLNNGTNLLVIRNGKACMTEADCPDRICVKTGWIQYNGQTITCLPNKVTVAVEEEQSGIDLVA